MPLRLLWYRTLSGLTISGAPSANPIKIAIALEELGLEYSYIALDVKLRSDRIKGLERQKRTWRIRTFKATTKWKSSFSHRWRDIDI
jgi:hypothetical protein